MRLIVPFVAVASLAAFHADGAGVLTPPYLQNVHTGGITIMWELDAPRAGIAAMGLVISVSVLVAVAYFGFEGIGTVKEFIKGLV